MSTTFAELAAGQILKHPKNVRHKAAADDELVESIKAHGLVQPIVVAPTNGSDKYVLIAGHRRLDGCKKAGVRQIPAIVRSDLVTEGQQVEAMLIENGRRLDLTPIEEAEGYAQLELLGYKAPAIATAVGRDVKTIRARMKLLKLSPATRKKVHAGQLTLEHAAQLVEFADDPDTTSRLEAAARNEAKGMGVSLDYELKQARRRRDALQKAAVEATKLLEAGATELTIPKGKGAGEVITWARTGDLPVRLDSTPSTDWGQHKGCLVFVQDPGSSWSLPGVRVGCSKPTSHDHLLDEEKAKDLAEQEQHRLEREARAAAEADAQELRVATATKITEGAKVPTAVADLVRSLLPAVLTMTGREECRGIYQDLMGIDEADRWSDNLTNPESRGKKARALFAQHLDDLANSSDAKATKALVAALVAAAEYQLTASWNRVDAVAHDYVRLLEELGHPFVDVDLELAAKVAPKDTTTATRGGAA